MIRRSGIDKPVNELTREDGYLMKRSLVASGYDPKYIRQCLGSASALLSALLEEEKLEHNPLVRIKITNADKVAAHEARALVDETHTVNGREVVRFNGGKPRRVPAWEFWAVLSHLPAAWRPVLMLVVCGGFRPGELALLDLRRWDPSTQTLAFDKSLSRQRIVQAGTKNDHGRTPEDQVRVTIAPTLIIEMLDPVQLSDGRLFRSPSGGLFDYHNFTKRILHPASERAGVARFTLKDLRHTLSSELHSAGIPTTDIAFWMGDAARTEDGERIRSEASRTYNHPDSTHVAAALEVMLTYVGLKR